MNHTATTKKNLAIVAVLAAITAALTGTIAISVQNAAAQTTTDLENSATDFKFKQKEKNNCSGFANCCNSADEAFGVTDFLIRCTVSIPPPT
jgi:Na+-translocating ferredoxin:NAD+ oxidoreductase RnfG subunit